MSKERWLLFLGIPMQGQIEQVCPVDTSYADLFHDTNWAGAVNGFITNALKNEVSGHKLQVQNTSK